MIHKNVVLDFNSLFLFDLSFSISHLLTPLGCSLKLNLSAGGSNMKTMMMPMLILLGTAAAFTLCCYYCHRMLHNWKLPGIWNMFRILDSTFYFTLYVGERKIRQMFGVFSNSFTFLCERSLGCNDAQLPFNGSSFVAKIATKRVATLIT